MQRGYFKTAWSDITQSPHWVMRILLLALLCFIPVFGWIVIAGYLWGWARDMAWGVHAPLPERIFENADGTLYSRGFFTAVIAVVCAAVMNVLQSAGGLISSGSFAGSAFVWGDVHSIYQTVAPLGLVSGLLSLFSFAVLCAVSFIVTLFKWVGTMRMSIYGRLSAGFQVSRIWAMMRHDFKGILRILGMWLIVSFVAGIAIALAVGVVIFAGILCVSFFASTGVHASDASFLPIVVAAMILMLVALAVALFAAFLGVMGCALVVRAVGQWTCQFDVANWRGQDDPMPFELKGAQAKG